MCSICLLITRVCLFFFSNRIIDVFQHLFSCFHKKQKLAHGCGKFMGEKKMNCFVTAEKCKHKLGIRYSICKYIVWIFPALTFFNVVEKIHKSTFRVIFSVEIPACIYFFIYPAIRENNWQSLSFLSLCRKSSFQIL